MARVADLVPEPEGFETALRGLEVPQGILAGAGEIAHRVIVHLGDIDGGEITRAHPPGQWHRVTTVGVHAVARLLGNQCGSDDPAAQVLLRAITLEPVPAGSRVIDQDQVGGVGWKRSDEVINVGLPGADGAEVDGLSAVFLGDRGHRDGSFVAIQADVQGARLVHG
jgi:hypothetical protein